MDTPAGRHGPPHALKRTQILGLEARGEYDPDVAKRNWDRVRAERLMTKEIGPGEPAAWDPLPPLGGPDRQRDVTRGSPKKGAARAGLPKTGYRSVTVGRKARAKRAAEERAEKEAQDRRKAVRSKQPSPEKSSAGEPRAAKAASSNGARSKANQVGTTTNAKSKRQGPIKATPKGSQIDQVFAAVRSRQAKASSPMSRTTLPD